VFTLNNPTEAEEEALKSSSLKFVIYQHEIGEQGTPHLQGYAVFNTAQRLPGAKRILGSDRYHLERRRGTADQALVSML